MNTRNYFVYSMDIKKLHIVIFAVLTMLLAIPYASVQAHDGPGMPMDRHHPMDDGHMNDGTNHMEINGSVSVSNSIILNIIVKPTQEASDEINSQHHHMDSNQYVNQMNVSFSKLVEFTDVTGNGFSNDDIIVSQYDLSQSNLNQPQLVNNAYYLINSKNDNVFSMTIDLNYENNVFYGFKWSLNITYPFTSENTSLAMVHQISTSRGEMSNIYREQNGINQASDCNLNGNEMNDVHENLPMFFSWADNVSVDGVSTSVSPTLVNQSVVISVPQGNNIYYDPTIGVDPTSLSIVDNRIASLGDFVNKINSPTLTGLIVASALIGVIIIFGLKKKST